MQDVHLSFWTPVVLPLLDFYIDKTGHQMVGREANRYYHCENGCLVNRHPYFSASLLRLEQGLQLNSFQLNHLQRALHVQFQ